MLPNSRPLPKVSFESRASVSSCQPCVSPNAETFALLQARRKVTLRSQSQLTGRPRLQILAKSILSPSSIPHASSRSFAASELNKNKVAHISVRSDVKYALTELNKIVEKPDDISAWIATCKAQKSKHPFAYDESFDGILQQHAIRTLSNMTKDRDTFVSVGVGQHQMWAAQFFQFRKPRTWMSSSGLGTMGFGLPAAMGIQAAHPDALVIDIDGDGSFQMNIQELATLFCEKLPVKVLLLNNQHLGMVVQWEDRFEGSNRAHTYLGPIDDEEARGAGSTVAHSYASKRYPNFVQIAKGYGCGAATVSKKRDLEAALQEMISHPGPFVLDVEVPFQEHVLPMIPGGKTVEDMILK